jgi:hypothetical protein
MPCAICRSDHDGGQLCSRCSQMIALGMYDAALLEAGSAYLRNLPQPEHIPGLGWCVEVDGTLTVTTEERAKELASKR